MLVRQHVDMKHDVLVLASTETYNSEYKLDYTEACEYMGSDGAKVIRLPYQSFLPHSINVKFRSYPRVYRILNEFSPDVIMCHGPCFYELLTIARYVKHNPGVKFYVDSHEDKYNSARSYLSKLLLYSFFYVPIIKFSKIYIDKFFYLSYECKSFCQDIYGLKESDLEFFPLGGIVFDDEDYSTRRTSMRSSLDIDESNVLFFQSGKFDTKKKILQSLRAFMKNKSPLARFVIAGGFDDELKSSAMDLINSDSRIQYIGWANPEMLQNLLCAADVYVQPGSQSATLQMSICARCAVIVDDVPSHRFIIADNGVFVRDQLDLESAYNRLIESPRLIYEMSRQSHNYASANLDYRKLAERLLE
jgi:glycosyltransferase involved in cell wall biosynthesis